MVYLANILLLHPQNFSGRNLQSIVDFEKQIFFTADHCILCDNCTGDHCTYDHCKCDHCTCGNVHVIYVWSLYIYINCTCNQCTHDHLYVQLVYMPSLYNHSIGRIVHSTQRNTPVDLVVVILACVMQEQLG